MNMKSIFKLGVLGLYGAAIGAASLALTLGADVKTASAHGERSQEPFLRMRSIQWYDMKWQPKVTESERHCDDDRGNFAWQKIGHAAGR